VNRHGLTLCRKQKSVYADYTRAGTWFDGYFGIPKSEL